MPYVVVVHMQIIASIEGCFSDRSVCIGGLKYPLGTATSLCRLYSVVSARAIFSTPAADQGGKDSS